MRLPGIAPEQLKRYQPFIAIGAGAVGAAVVLLVIRAWVNDRAWDQVRALHWAGRSQVLYAEETAHDVRGGSEAEPIVHLSALDARTGKRLSRVSVSPTLSFIGASRRGAWFNEPSGLGIHRRDVRTLEISASEDDWRNRSSALGEPRRVEAPLDERMGIPIRFSSGKRQWLDPDSLDIRPWPDEPTGTWSERPSVDLTDAQRGSAPAVRIGRLHGHASWVPAGTQRSAIECSGVPVGAQGFVAPSFLAVGSEMTGVLLDGPEFLVVHRPAEGAEAGIALSRIDCHGERKWTVLLGDGRVAGALMGADGAVFLVVRNPKGNDRVICVDTRTGEFRWAFPR